jgi:hypothetical protein
MEPWKMYFSTTKWS